jgi:serine/threonine protein kinase
MRENDLGEQEIANLVAGLCDVLAYLHHRPEPVIHRDIKPQNVIVRPDGSVALIDFDIARTYSAGRKSDTVFFGTRAYAAAAVLLAFAEETGILTGANQPYDISIGELALIFASADRVFDGAERASR